MGMIREWLRTRQEALDTRDALIESQALMITGLEKMVEVYEQRMSTSDALIGQLKEARNLDRELIVAQKELIARLEAQVQ